MSFAVGFGLHHIDVRSYIQTSTPGASTSTFPTTSCELPPPRNEEDLIQRVRLWHSIFTVRLGFLV